MTESVFDKSPGVTEIMMIVDRSGSMNSIRDDAQGAINNFIREQKTFEGKAYFTLIQFDTQYEVVHSGVEMIFVPENYTLIPRAATALLDAVGRGVSDLIARVKDGRKVVVVIITDGHENSSREFNLTQVRRLLEKAQAKDWQVVYLGANVDAFAEAGGMSINVGTTMGYGPTGQSVQASVGRVSSKLKDYRVGTASTMNFTEEERKDQEELDEK